MSPQLPLSSCSSTPSALPPALAPLKANLSRSLPCLKTSVSSFLSTDENPNPSAHLSTDEGPNSLAWHIRLWSPNYTSISISLHFSPIHPTLQPYFTGSECLTSSSPICPLSPSSNFQWSEKTFLTLRGSISSLLQTGPMGICSSWIVKIIV